MMRRRTWMSWSFSAVFSTVVVVTIYFFFVSKSQESVEQLSLQLSRQLVAQVNQLVLEAKFRQEKDPISWASQKVSAGADPRLFKVIPARAPATVQSEEVYELNRRTGAFDYFRSFDQSSGEGIRIFIEPNSSFLGGIHNHWAQDLILAVIWLSVFLSMGWFFLMRRTKRKNNYLQVELKRWTERGLGEQKQMTDWVRRIQIEIDALERFEQVMKRINEYSGWAEKAAQSFLESGYDDPREILWQAQRLHDYLTKLHQVTDRGQSLLSQYHKKIRTSAEWTPQNGTQA